MPCTITSLHYHELALSQVLIATVQQSSLLTRAIYLCHKAHPKCTVYLAMQYLLLSMSCSGYEAKSFFKKMLVQRLVTNVSNSVCGQCIYCNNIATVYHGRDCTEAECNKCHAHVVYIDRDRVQATYTRNRYVSKILRSLLETVQPISTTGPSTETVLY